MDYYEGNRRVSGRRINLPLLIGSAVILLLVIRRLAQFLIDYEWWREMGQVETWVQVLTYGVLPGLVGALLVFAVLYVTHARALRHADTQLREHRTYALVTTFALIVLSLMVAFSQLDSWTVVRYVGSIRAGGGSEWQDPVFGKPLSFYFFALPFWRALLGLVLGTAVIAGIVYLVASRFWGMRGRWEEVRETGDASELLGILHPADLLRTRFVRAAVAMVFLAMAVLFYLERYDLMSQDHGSLVGVDWTAEHVTLPLLYALIAACVAGAAIAWLGRFKLLIGVAVIWLAVQFVPGIMTSVYVRPSEITIQKPYIERHIAATLEAYNLSQRLQESEYGRNGAGTLNLAGHKALFDNVRLWDWNAFHSTVTQIQALRPYYRFFDSDVDRYMIGGQLRQVLLSPRELDVTQLPADARSRWINPHFIYTHGYGLVVAEAARITGEGLPMLLVQDAPPQVKTPELKLSRPEIYYGEVTHEPVFVRTKQPEFNYPMGASNVETKYEGKGGFPISSLATRLAATLATGDWNILLTTYLQNESRMMIRRNVRERLERLAGFMMWDADPYLVVTNEGRLVWIVDGYTASDAHPYSKLLPIRGEGTINYMRNPVKATIDAYDGTTKMYVFDEQDAILRAYRAMFPGLFTPASEMPADLRAHARYPETIFRVQSEIYRTFHMRDPEAFFNKEDLWDLARRQSGSDERAESVSPTYLVATVPGSKEPEFLLMTTFTPRGKDNLIGVMLARCDKERLGEIIVLQLSKQELIYGPMQVAALINQDQTISKDLSLWNQQGSRVLRGQMMVLPVDEQFVYIEPIYIQSSEARMPQLKKVAIASGKQLAYADTYEQALAQVAGMRLDAAANEKAAAAEIAAAAATPGTAPAPPVADRSPAVVEQLRQHLRRYRELSSQGRFSEAGREMEAMEKLLGR